jgi:putative transposase
MECVDCGSAATSERRDRTAQGYRRFRCRDCGRQFNERSGGLLNRTQYPSDVIALVVLWRLRYRLTLQELSEAACSSSAASSSATKPSANGKRNSHPF